MSGDRRSLKPVFYIACACVSLYSVTRIVEPILAIREDRGGAGGLIGALPGLSQALGGSSSALPDLDQLPAGGGLSDLQTYLKENGLTGAASTDDAGQAALAPPKEIVVRDVRLIGNERDDARRSAFLKALALQHEGRLDEAQDAYEALLNADPNDSGVRRNLAIVHYQRGDYGAAWAQVHAVRDLEREVPAEFVALLAQKMPDPRR